MEKVLHDYFIIKTGNEIKFYSSQDVGALIEAANIHIERCNGKEVSSLAPVLEGFFYEYINEYYKNGITDDLLKNLNKELEQVNIQCLTENVNNKLTALYLAHIPFNSPKLLGAYMFFGITSFGGFDGLKRCLNKR